MQVTFHKRGTRTMARLQVFVINYVGRVDNDCFI